MKILQINTFYIFGSTGRIVSDLKQVQESQGLDSYVVYGTDTNANNRGENLKHIYRMHGVIRRKYNILRTRLFDHHGFYNEKETKKMIKWIDDVEPDIIHLHNIHNHYVHVGMLFEYIKNKNIPIVWTLHDCWSFTGHCSHFCYIKCMKWKTECYKCAQRHRYPQSWFLDRCTTNFRDKRKAFCGVSKLIMVSPSYWLSELTRESYLNCYPIKVINNGVDISSFKPQNNEITLQKLGIKGKKILLAMSAGFGIRKGGEYLKQLPSLLHENEVLMLVGKGAQKLSSMSPDKCIGIEYSNNVQELAEYYSVANVFVNPTLEDNFPTTNIEALSCGTPIVTFNTGGSVEAVLDGEEICMKGDVKYTSVGAVVPQGDLNTLLSAAREVMSKEKNYYIETCRRKAEIRYNKNNQYQKYIDLYKELVR